VLDAGKTILTGTHNHSNGMWQIALPVTSPTHVSNHIGKQLTAEMVAFAHATLFSPSLSTLEKALTKGYLTNLPGLDAQALRKYPPASVPMAKGHLDQSRKNQRSTTRIKPDTDDPMHGLDGSMPTSDPSKHSNATAPLQSQLDRSIPTKQVASFCHPAPAIIIFCCYMIMIAIISSRNP
jgi:hypothetical protein